MTGSIGIFVSALHASVCSAEFLQFVFGLLVATAFVVQATAGGTAILQATLAGTVRADTAGLRRLKASGKVLQRYAPEALGLMALGLMAIALRLCGSIGANGGTADEATWDHITNQWPVLITADSLLALQAMLRLLVLISTVLRMDCGATLISQEVAGISLGAGIGRIVLFVLGPAYRLEGPLALGGYLPGVCELVSVLLLAILCRKKVSGVIVAASVLTLAAAAWIGSRNRLKLVDDVFTDGLFIFAHTAELVAAFAYLTRALSGLGSSRRNVALIFAHVVMPLQQSLAAYYFVQAFDNIPAMIGAGRPFAILQVGAVAQAGAYVAAAVLSFAEYLETPTEELCMPDDDFSIVPPRSFSYMPQDELPVSEATAMPRRAATSFVL